jgi:hypothetical protein
MSEAMFRRESPTEYFRELVETAMQYQHVKAHEQTSFYVVNLLAGFVYPDQRARPREDDPLGIRLVTALHADGIAQRDGLRHVGDRALFVSGFFSDSLHRSQIDIDYYNHLGAYAYGSLARLGHPAFGGVFDELASKFTAFVDVLSEVSERTALTSNADILRLYEKWLRTGSPRSADLLSARGIVPIRSAGSRTIQ